MVGDGERTRREVRIEASPGEVWERVVDVGAWLGEDESGSALDAGADLAVSEDGVARRGVVETADPPEDGRPGRLVWWWWREEGEPTRVEVLVTPADAATRVVVVESRPAGGPVMTAGWRPRLAALRLAVGRAVVAA